MSGCRAWVCAIKLAQRVGRFGATVEAVLAARQSQQHEAELALLGQQVFGVQLAQGWRTTTAFRARAIDSAAAGRAIRPGWRPEPLQLVARGGRCRREFAARSSPRSCWHMPPAMLPRFSGDQSPARIGPSFVQKPIDAQQLVGRQIVQALGANLAQVDFVQHGVEQPVLARQRRRQLFEHRHDLLAAGAFDHDDGVVFVAELLDVFDPQPVVVALGIEQIEAAGLIAQPRGGEIAGDRRQAERRWRSWRRETPGSAACPARRGGQEIAGRPRRSFHGLIPCLPDIRRSRLRQSLDAQSGASKGSAF